MTLDLTCDIGGTAHALPYATEQRNPADLEEVVARAPDAGATEAAEASGAARTALGALRAGIEGRADALSQIAVARAGRRGELG